MKLKVVRNMKALRVREIRAINLKKNEVCLYCGTRLSVEREVFENDKLFTGHNCMGIKKEGEIKW